TAVTMQARQSVATAKIFIPKTSLFSRCAQAERMRSQAPEIRAHTSTILRRIAFPYITDATHPVNYGGSKIMAPPRSSCPEKSGYSFRNLSDCNFLAGLRCSGCLVTNSNKIADVKFPYPYEEFANHVKAMKTVREWE